MKIERIGESYYPRKLIDCTVCVGPDLKVIKASETYYAYMGDRHYDPVSSCITPEDGALLLAYAQNPTDKIELVTHLADKQGGNKVVYLRMEPITGLKEDAATFRITIYDICDGEERTKEVEAGLAKYRHFLTVNSEWCSQYFFEYGLENDWLEIYKYVNERAVVVISEPLDDFVRHTEEENDLTEEQKEQMQTFCNYLRSVNISFEMEFTMQQQEHASTCFVKGGPLYKNKKIVAGIMVPNQLSEKEAYYMTPAAYDAGTGVFNKKAVMEYTMECLHLSDGQVRWFVLLDIDDFKDINDTYGHMFGDEVIRKVAEVLQINVGYRGVVGRFGGDEFFVLLEKIPDRISLKNLLRAIIMELQYAFAPKFKVRVSMGISQYPVDGSSYEVLFEKADKSLYIAKDKGKNRHIIYDEKMHGSLQKDEHKTVSVAYTISRGKRREAMLEILDNLYLHGTKYITETPLVQKRLRDIYDLDGVSIYSDYGRKVLCHSGDYGGEPYELEELFQSGKYIELYTEDGSRDGSEDILVVSAVKIKNTHPNVYEQMMRQEINTSVQCLSRKEGKPYALVTFDVINRNRKWSDTDTEMLTMIGKCIGNMLCRE